MAGTVYSACWDFDRLNLSGAGAVFTGGVTGSVSLTGMYAHGAISMVGGSGVLIDGVALKNLMTDFVAGLTGSPSFNFVESAQGYALQAASTFAVTWTGTMGTALRDILGFAGNLSGTNAYASTRRPKYIIVPVVGGQSAVHEAYESRGRVSYAESESGHSFSTHPDTVAMWRDWVQPFEGQYGPTDAAWSGNAFVAGAPMRIRDYTASGYNSVWWSWEEFYKHVRAEMPFRLYDINVPGDPHVFYKLRGEGAHFDPPRVTADFDGHWSPEFKTVEKPAWYFP